ncbi:ATP-binding protein [Paenibacillus pini]|uniref:ATP-binding protein n=1 Tax=Paenibacillus pini TaxID=669461 RepID=UPI0009DE6096|nr:ATP-binding protein [Paenibacillus pini]
MESMPLGGIVTLHLQRPEYERVMLGIEDQGIGIPVSMMPKLGEPFFTNKKNGTGLGLMVSQRIVEGHKGNMEIESVQGKATKVAITLPTAVQ